MNDFAGSLAKYLSPCLCLPGRGPCAMGITAPLRLSTEENGVLARHVMLRFAEDYVLSRAETANTEPRRPPPMVHLITA